MDIVDELHESRQRRRLLVLMMLCATIFPTYIFILLVCGDSCVFFPRNIHYAFLLGFFTGFATVMYIAFAKLRALVFQP